jgi:DNA mismatch endonuclease (patch repair protein)
MTKQKIAIFCDSEFFHGKDWDVLKPKLETGAHPEYWVQKIERNRERDTEIDRKLLCLGWTVIHFWGKDIMDKTESCIEVIEETIFEEKIGEESP